MSPSKINCESNTVLTAAFYAELMSRFHIPLYFVSHCSIMRVHK